MLVSGAPPAAVPAILLTTSSTINQQKTAKVPLVNFVRECRVVVQIIGETIATIKLANTEKWGQLFTDGTTRRQIAFQNLVVGLMDEEGQLDPIAVSSCIFLENETSEKQLESLLGRINLLKHRLI